ncbi:MAG: hypothetical protein K0R83_170 [Caulobacter sp.]|nr:hypothetical protein [Caulobacter sp.]
MGLEGGMQDLDLTPRLVETLDRAARAGRGLAEPWWIFGSAAMALAGVRGLDPPDVDVISTPEGAAALLERLGGERVAGASDRFRSVVFGKCLEGPLPVEVMGGFEVATAEGWAPVILRTRRRIAWPAGDLWIAEAAEQAAVCRLFGRPKDLARAAALDDLDEKRPSA